MIYPQQFEKDLSYIRKNTSRNISVYPIKTETECSVCKWDSVRNRGADPDCPTCAGSGLIIVLGTVALVKAKIRWINPQSVYTRLPGRTDEGRVTFICDSSYESIIKAAGRIVIDGKDVQIYTDSNGKLAIRPLQNFNGVIDKIKVSCKVTP